MQSRYEDTEIYYILVCQYVGDKNALQNNFKQTINKKNKSM